MNTKLQRHANYFLGLLVLGCAVLYNFPPQEYHFYPICPFYAVTHLLCPGCGGTRALYYLLHGNISEALRLNAMVTLLAPVALAWFLYFYVVVMRNRPAPRLRLHWGVTTGLIMAAALFAVLRNTGIAFTI